MDGYGEVAEQKRVTAPLREAWALHSSACADSALLGSPQGTLQKFVDDLFQVILSTNRPVPLAVKYFFDLLDEQASHYGIADPETIHIWKTNRYGVAVGSRGGTAKLSRADGHLWLLRRSKMGVQGSRLWCGKLVSLGGRSWEMQ